MANKYGFFYLSSILLFSHSIYNMHMEPGENTTTFKNSHNQIFPRFNASNSSDESGQEKQKYINNYYNEWFQQLKTTSSNSEDLPQQEKLVFLTFEAYQHLCLDKNINLAPEEFWKKLRIKVRMEERQDGATKVDTQGRHIQVKTPLTDTFTKVKDRTEQIIEIDEKMHKDFIKHANKQNRYNDTIESQIQPKDFAELGFILPYHVVQEAVIDHSAHCLSTNLIYYINGNAQYKEAIDTYKKNIIELNNSTAQNLQYAEKLNPHKKNINSQERSHLIFNQLNQLKEKRNVQN
jgi:hypothetical protein